MELTLSRPGNGFKVFLQKYIEQLESMSDKGLLQGLGELRPVWEKINDHYFAITRWQLA
jgi:hypothetical protein